MARRVLLFVLGVALAAGAFELVARAVMADRPGEIRWYDAATQLKVEQMDDRGDVDVVIAGTSMAWQAFVPEVIAAETGMTVYNAGLAGGTPEVMDRWLLEEVEPRLGPTTVVWGLSSFDVAPAWGEQQEEAYDEALATRTGWLARVEQRVARYSTLVANRTVLRSLSATFGDEADARQAELDEAAEFLGSSGERLDFRIDLDPERGEIVAARLTGSLPSSGDLESIEQTVSTLRDRGIEVVMAELPAPGRFIAAHPGGQATYGRVGTALADLAARLGVRYIRPVGSFPDTNFVDYTHLDEASAAGFSRGFAQALASGVDDARLDATDPDEVATDDDGDIATGDVPPGCEIVIVEDEYGFPVEIIRCEGDTDGAEDLVTEGDEGDGDEAEIIRISADPLTQRFLYQWDCTGDSADPLDEIRAYLSPERLVLLDAALARLDEAIRLCGDDGYLPLFEAAVTSLEGVAGFDRTPVDRASTAETASRAIAAIEQLRLELEQRNVTRSSGVWFHADEAASRLWLEQREEEGDPVRVVSLGSSVANAAIDQDRFAAAYDDSFLNLAIAGADPEEWVVIDRRLFEGVTRPELVIWPLTTHRLLDAPGRRCASLAGPHLRTTTRYRRQLFPEFRPTLTAGRMIMGPTVEGSPFLETPAAASVVARYSAPGVRYPTEGTFQGIPAGDNRYPDAQFCSERMDALSEAITEMQAAGSEVVMVLLPVHPFVLAQSDLHQFARDELEATVAGAGARFIELAEPYADDETYDGWHPNPTGQARITQELLPALGVG